MFCWVLSDRWAKLEPRARRPGIRVDNAAPVKKGHVL